jgi:hypothetical protein
VYLASGPARQRDVELETLKALTADDDGSRHLRRATTRPVRIVPEQTFRDGLQCPKRDLLTHAVRNEDRRRAPGVRRARERWKGAKSAGDAIGGAVVFV